MLKKRLHFFRRNISLSLFLRKLNTCLTIFYRKATVAKQALICCSDRLFILEKNEPVTFIDCGANLGQSFKWFSTFFCTTNVSFVLFEPNPNCEEFLTKAIRSQANKSKLVMAAVGLSNGYANFYGIEKGDLMFSQGAAIAKSPWHETSDVGSTLVKTIDLREFLTQEKQNNAQLIMKMDIEGAEIEILEEMIKDNSITAVDVLYVEFHSRFFPHEEQKKLKKREQTIVKSLSKKGVKVRQWH